MPANTVEGVEFVEVDHNKFFPAEPGGLNVTVSC